MSQQQVTREKKNNNKTRQRFSGLTHHKVKVSQQE